MTAPKSAARMTESLDSENPFPGLRYFVEEESPYFIGRRREIRELVRRIGRDPLTVLFGVSGLGKTSLLLAGVFPELRAKGYFPVRVRLDYRDDAGDFAEQIVEQILQAASEHEVDATDHEPGESLWEYFHRAEFWDPRNRLKKPVLVLDQFEEIFSIGAENKDKRIAPFVRELGDLIENRIPIRDRARINRAENLGYSISKQAYRIVLSMREDYLPELEAWHRLIPSIGSNRMRLRPMNGEAALSVVTQVKDRVSEDVAIEIVRYVAAAKDDVPLEELEVEPALLSVVCRELNRRRINDNSDQITRDLLQETSGQFLDQLYEGCLNRYPEVRGSLQELIEDQLLTRSGMRDNVACEDVIDESRGITEELLQSLVEERLVRIEERSNHRRLELTHDLWTGVVQSSRDRRYAREEAERREQKRKEEAAKRKKERQEALEAERAEAKAREDQLRASKERLRTIFAWSVGVAVVVVGTIAYFAKGWWDSKEILRARSEELVQLNKSLSERSSELSLAYDDLRNASQQFFMVQSAVDSLDPYLKLLQNAQLQLANLTEQQDFEGYRATVTALDAYLITLQDDILENYSYLQATTDEFKKVSNEILDEIEDVEVEVVTPADPFEMLASADSAVRKQGLDLLLVNRINDIGAVQRAIDELTRLGRQFDGPHAEGLLAYLRQTPLALWSGTEMRRLFKLLDESDVEEARAVVAHVTMAALGYPDDEIRADRSRYLARNTDSELLIGQMLAALDEEVLNPRGRFNAVYFLHSSELSAWTPDQKSSGCEISASLMTRVGASTQAEIAKLDDKLDCG
jgi:hypothetical protein